MCAREDAVVAGVCIGVWHKAGEKATRNSERGNVLCGDGNAMSFRAAKKGFGEARVARYSYFSATHLN